MSVITEDVKMKAREKVQKLLETMCHIPVKPQTPIDWYYKSSQYLLDQAEVHYKDGRLEESFILYSRYIILHVEELKKHHPDYLLVSGVEKARANELIKTAFLRAEELKQKVRQKYEQNISRSEEEIKRQESSTYSETTATTKSKDMHNENELEFQKIKANYVYSQPGLKVENAPIVPATDSAQSQIKQDLSRKPTIDRATKPNFSANYSNLTSCRRVMIPSDITKIFLDVAQRNTIRSIETCGILAGSKKDDRYVITHIVVPKQNGGPDSCDTEKEEEMIEYITGNDLITLGWIHTHPTQTAFLSSVDLHTHLPYQMLLSEAIAIVISPKFDETGVFSLTNDRGIPVISTCNKTGFHEHVNIPPLYQHIGLLYYLNKKSLKSCSECYLIKMKQMQLYNVSYSTLLYQQQSIPSTINVRSPFLIDDKINLIKILRFNTILPYFHTKKLSDSMCIGLDVKDKLNNKNGILYVKEKITNKNIILLMINGSEVFISDCLDHYWFYWPIIIDVLNYLSYNRYNHGLNRYIQIDIDDIFLGSVGSRLKSSDIEALVQSQKFIQKYINNFQFRLGYCGWYFQRGTKEENDADRLLIEYKNEFVWFHHTWKHLKLNKIIDKRQLIDSTERNVEFSRKYRLPLDPSYTIGPHHSGIYPINPIVYDVWKNIYGWNVTSTENYPYHYPSQQHRGFIYQGIQVLPRQTCGLFTNTLFYDQYPNGSHRLERNLMGGQLFRAMLTKPISIFMTHQMNYGYDRLANYLFSKLIYHISNWTNIRLQSVTSNELAQKYFSQYYPNDREPVFTNPCDDNILLKLWSHERTACNIFPKFIIVGPQKTGSTALHAMLLRHPSLRSTKASLTTFEEHEVARNQQKITFDNLLQSNKVDQLKKRCLNPGHYDVHLNSWLTYFTPKQIYIVDGEAFRENPQPIIDDIQKNFLNLSIIVNSSSMVGYSKKKQFFCPKTLDDRLKCLGPNKGRSYPSMGNN
ncbi:unnamed protein product, partial [Didymodactylos carnosus]